MTADKVSAYTTRPHTHTVATDADVDITMMEVLDNKTFVVVVVVVLFGFCLGFFFILIKLTDYTV